MGKKETEKLRIRDIRAKHLDKSIQIEGIIRQTSEIRPQVVSAKFKCNKCGTVLSVLQADKTFMEPQRCSCGKKDKFVLIGRDWIDVQRIIVEELPKTIEKNDLPRQIAVFLKEKLTDPSKERLTRPSSKVKVVGTLVEMPVILDNDAISNRCDLAIVAEDVALLGN